MLKSIDYKQIFKAFKENANAQQASKRSAYMQNKFPFFGILSPKRKELTKKSQQLQDKYGSSFELTNIRRMLRFAEEFTNYEIVATLPTRKQAEEYADIFKVAKIMEQVYLGKNKWHLREPRRSHEKRIPGN